MKKNILLLGVLMSCFASTAFAKQLTTYVTEWGGYGASGYPSYPFDGSHPSQYGDTTVVRNADMVQKVKQSDVVAYAFLQVWNPNSAQAKQFNVPADWAGQLHFDDLWANLPGWSAKEGPAWKTFCSAVGHGSCAAVQQDCSSGACHPALLRYQDINVGQMNNFGAFVNLDDNNGKTAKILAIGGANTAANQSVSTDSFQAIFANEDIFLASLSNWMSNLSNMSSSTTFGVDYDFEPPTDANGAQKSPDMSTLTDYASLYQLVKNTRQKLDSLGKHYYISVTITCNEGYLDYINRSVDGGWFKQIAPYVDHVNIMTYDMHGPWDLSGDPGAVSHIMLKNPTFMQNTYAINYGLEDVVNKVVNDYGMPVDKLQAGIAAYGRGFAGVAAGAYANYPGFDQSWSGPSNFDVQYSNNQVGLLPYKFVNTLLSQGYKNYNIDEGDGVIASYIYNPQAQQLVGYESPEEVKTFCQYIKKAGLGGAILWSMDTDASASGTQGASLISTYKDNCGAV